MLKSDLEIDSTEQKESTGLEDLMFKLPLSFYASLYDVCPRISNTDLRHCSLIIYGMSAKEASVLLGVSPDSVKVARYRLKKRLGLSKDDSLNSFVRTVCSSNVQELEKAS